MLFGKGMTITHMDRRILLLLPAVGLVCVFFVYPVGSLLLSSATEPHLGVQNYAELASKPLYGPNERTVLFCSISRQSKNSGA
jgi:ABC-type sugar transport system permease subunit